MKKINLIPILDACDFPCDVEDELAENEISTHYNHDIICFDWKDNNYPIFQKWLIDTYGENVKKYWRFGIIGT